MNTIDKEAPQDLDTRIAIAEARLVARQEQLRLQWEGLRTRVEHSVQPRKWVLPAAAATLALLALRSMRHHPEPGRNARAPEASRGRGSLPGRLLRWLPLVLPLLPLPWRDKLGPTVSSSVVRLAFPLARRAWQGRDKGSLPQTMSSVDLSRYAGHWYEVARLPALHGSGCASQPRTEFRASAQGLQVINRCRDADGRERLEQGVVRVQPRSGGARLQLSFAPQWMQWLPFVWADHWILHVDDDYGIALAGTPERDALWLLSRQPELSIAQFRHLIGVAREQGYALRELRFS